MGKLYGQEGCTGCTSETRREHAPQDAQKGRPARPQRVETRGVPSGYVEGLHDARTTLAGFFSILLGWQWDA